MGASDFDADTILNLSDSQIHTVALSRVFADVFEATITDMAAPGGGIWLVNYMYQQMSLGIQQIV